jgi:OmcA/MtrC family decaheme c-type cytochrome
MPLVTFQVVNPQAGNAAYTLTEPAWSQTANGASRLAIDIAWSTLPANPATDVNYDNAGSGSNPGQPVSIDALKNKVAGSAAGTFTVTSTVAVPANAGLGQIVMEGHPAESIGTPATTARIPVKTANLTFAVGSGTGGTRRKVVDINKCNACHINLSLHGSNRNSNIEACVSCHNQNATDITQRPKSGPTADGKAEETIDFKRLIHGIHGAQFAGGGPIIYGFGGSVNDFSKAGFPGNDMCRSNTDNCLVGNCEVCHVAGTQDANFAPARGTTTSTQTLADPTSYLRTTKITATCSSCHAQSLPVDHMKQNGGQFNVTQAQIDAAQ